MSHLPSASNTLPAASKVKNSIGAASRLASSRASSAETPRGSPLAGSFCASTILPKLIATRSLTVGAGSVTTLRGTLSAMAPPPPEKSSDHRRAGEASGLSMEGILGQGGRSERACIARPAAGRTDAADPPLSNCAATQSTGRQDNGGNEYCLNDSGVSLTFLHETVLGGAGELLAL